MRSYVREAIRKTFKQQDSTGLAALEVLFINGGNCLDERVVRMFTSQVEVDPYLLTSLSFTHSVPCRRRSYDAHPAHPGAYHPTGVLVAPRP